MHHALSFPMKTSFLWTTSNTQKKISTHWEVSTSNKKYFITNRPPSIMFLQLCPWSTISAIWPKVTHGSKHVMQPAFRVQNKKIWKPNPEFNSIRFMQSYLKDKYVNLQVPIPPPQPQRDADHLGGWGRWKMSIVIFSNAKRPNLLINKLIHAL